MSQNYQKDNKKPDNTGKPTSTRKQSSSSKKSSHPSIQKESQAQGETSKVATKATIDVKDHRGRTRQDEIYNASSSRSKEPRATSNRSERKETSGRVESFEATRLLRDEKSQSTFDPTRLLRDEKTPSRKEQSTRPERDDHHYKKKDSIESKYPFATTFKSNAQTFPEREHPTTKPATTNEKSPTHFDPTGLHRDDKTKRTEPPESKYPFATTYKSNAQTLREREDPRTKPGTPTTSTSSSSKHPASKPHSSKPQPHRTSSSSKPPSISPSSHSEPKSLAPPTVKSILRTPYDQQMASRQPLIHTLTGRDLALQSAWAQSTLCLTAACPDAFSWREVPDGYHCSGTHHFISHSLLAEGKGGVYLIGGDLEGERWGPYYASNERTEGLMWYAGSRPRPGGATEWIGSTDERGKEWVKRNWKDPEEEARERQRDGNRRRRDGEGDGNGDGGLGFGDWDWDIFGTAPPPYFSGGRGGGYHGSGRSNRGGRDHREGGRSP